MLKIHELTDESGALVGIYLRVLGGEPPALEIVGPAGSLPLPTGALEKVLERYGAPFDPAARITVVGELQLGPGERLKHVLHLAGYDVVARDYLVLERSEGEALCAPGVTVAGALQHLASAAGRRQA